MPKLHLLLDVQLSNVQLSYIRYSLSSLWDFFL